MTHWIDEFHADVEALRLDAVLDRMTADVEVAVGNNPVMKGRDAVRQGLRGLFSTIDGIRHTTLNTAENGALAFHEMKVDYLRKDGRTVSVPVVSVFERRGGQVSALRIHLDIAPLFS